MMKSVSRQSRSFCTLLAIWLSCELAAVSSFSTRVPPSWISSTRHVLEHIFTPATSKEFVPLEDIANTRIPRSDGTELLAFVARPDATPESGANEKLPLLILIHEFFGLNQSIQQKAIGLAKDLNCLVVAPDTFRGTSTDFIPKAIWLAVTAPQERVNDDLDAVWNHFLPGQMNRSSNDKDKSKVAIMGFCYGGGKAIRYTTQRRPQAATVIFYGSPVTDVEQLQTLQAPVCGIYGRKDAQFPMILLDQFQESLTKAKIENDVRIYDGVGHAFWSDMEQVRRRDEPQVSAYQQCTSFLQRFFRPDDVSS